MTKRKIGFATGTVVEVRVPAEQEWYGVVHSQTAAVSYIQTLLKNGEVQLHQVPVNLAIISECVGYNGLSDLVLYLAEHHPPITQEMTRHCETEEARYRLIDIQPYSLGELVWHKLPLDKVLMYYIDKGLTPPRSAVDACADPTLQLTIAKANLNVFHSIWHKLVYEDAVMIALCNLRKARVEGECYDLVTQLMTLENYSDPEKVEKLIEDVYTRANSDERQALSLSNKMAYRCYKIAPHPMLKEQHDKWHELQEAKYREAIRKYGPVY